MVSFDADALCNIRIDGTLRQEGDAILLAGFFLKDTDKLGTDDLALLLRIADTGQLVQEAVDRIHVDQVGFHLVAENFDNLFGFTFAEQAVVDMHADQLLADGLDQQGGDNRTVHTAGKSQKNLFVTNLFPDCFHLLGDERLGERGSRNPFHAFGPFVAIHFLSSNRSVYTLGEYMKKNRKRRGKCQSENMTKA